MATGELRETAAAFYREDMALLEERVPMDDVVRIYRKARSDLGVLRVALPYGTVYKAGNMHYGYIFGRDLSIITEDNKDMGADNAEIEASPGGPYVGYEPLDASPVPALLKLADLQGKHTDPYNEEKFGKILHEEVTGPEHWAYDKSRKEQGRPLYSTVDASFRALELAVTSWGDVLTYDEQYPQYNAPQRIATMISGILTYAKSQKEEFRSELIYERRRNPDDYDKVHGKIYDKPQTPANLDWRDSGDSEQVSAGSEIKTYNPAIDPRNDAFDIDAYRAQKIGATLLRDPKVAAAYLNVQALLWSSIEHFDTRILDFMSNTGRALVEDCRSNNPALRQAILEDFVTSDGYFGYVLGRDGTLYDADTTDAVILIASGIADKDVADGIRDKVYNLNTFLTPYGVRSLSSQERHFDPYSYHNGSVWLHNNVQVIDAFIKGGYLVEAENMLHALLRGILVLEEKNQSLNLYELFCIPTDHPQAKDMRPYREVSGRDACSVQGWAASGLRRIIKTFYPSVLQAGLARDIALDF